MEKEFVPYELAVSLKALGFNEPCLGGYIRFIGSETFELAFYKYRNVDFNSTSNIYVSAPLYQQAFRWFREKYKQSHIWMMDELLDTGEYTYEEAELACLTKLIEIVESKCE